MSVWADSSHLCIPPHLGRMHYLCSLLTLRVCGVLLLTDSVSDLLAARFLQAFIERMGRKLRLYNDF